MHMFFSFFPVKRSEYGISAVVKQTLTLRETVKINDRIFDRSQYFLKMG